MQVCFRAAAFALGATVALTACGGGGSRLAPSTAAVAGSGQSGSAATARRAEVAALANKIKHLVVIYQENWSFDSLYGSFPGANGIANAGEAVQQVDTGGTPLSALPQPIGPEPITMIVRRGIPPRIRPPRPRSCREPALSSVRHTGLTAD